MNRLALAALAAVVVILPTRASAQQQTPQQETYLQKRAQLVKQLDSTQKSLTAAQSEHVQMGARIENVLSEVAERRANTLMLSSEQNSLKQIDSLLLASQGNLLMQRDRLQALGNAVRDRSGSMLVVLFRADSAGGTPVENATLSIDGGSTATRSYSNAANGALKVGAVDEVFRGNVLPVSHTLNFAVTAGGQPLTGTATVTAAGQSVTYVQFALRNGQLVQTTWTSRGTTPF
jgi:hypothetical protein